MHSYWRYQFLLSVVANFFTKEHPVSGDWPSWKCTLCPFVLTTVLFFIFQYPLLLQGDFSALLVAGSESLSTDLFCSLVFGFITTDISLDIYARIDRNKPERPWLWCLIAVLFWPVMLGILAIPFMVDCFRGT